MLRPPHISVAPIIAGRRLRQGHCAMTVAITSRRHCRCRAAVIAAALPPTPPARHRNKAAVSCPAMAFLTRTDPTRNIDPFYVVDITPTLFGEWAVLRE
jgi:hypothetical protein